MLRTVPVGPPYFFRFRLFADTPWFPPFSIVRMPALFRYVESDRGVRRHARSSRLSDRFLHFSPHADQLRPLFAAAGCAVGSLADVFRLAMNIHDQGFQLGLEGHIIVRKRRALSSRVVILRKRSRSRSGRLPTKDLCIFGRPCHPTMKSCALPPLPVNSPSTHSPRKRLNLKVPTGSAPVAVWRHPLGHPSSGRPSCP